ncbi:Pfs, NACHT, and Ankyrin domain protein [Trichoderma simmonsii]|uniref:Pfs, NACHT, and Ankyrin domain protein n=1 Tax=Trichoderma simmonsii TaxID=1491479 RepID=A0A8G0PJB1_9HYPO|nr:Pfs, NACHT, and Ankyrin domain protein [Trichoderma simmonsii]
MDDNSQNHQLGGQLPTETVERVGQNPHVGSPDTGNATSHFSGQGIQLTGPGDFNVGGNVHITTNNAAPTTAAKDCQHSLFITDPSEDRAALKRKKGNRAAGTCGWILETEELTAWLGQGQTSNVLWLYGNPGTGKSTMAIFLTEELTTMFSKMDDKTLVYFFCDSSFDKQKTATSILRGLLLQLVQQHQQLLEYILPKYNEQGAGLFKSFDALWTIFMAAAADQNTGQKYCIIDALDECDSESQKILLQQFQETFQIQNAPPNIRILVTSRPYSEIYEYLNEFANKNLASFPQAEKDIHLCIEEKVADLVKKKRYTTKVRQQVINILRDKAESTFLWVGLACEELREIPSKDAVKVLRDMPKGLHSLYKALLETVQKESEADIIRRILGFVAVCMWPLSILELSEVCQLHEEEEDIETRVQFTREQIASCRLMIIIQDEKVLLLHQSVKDFLVGTTPDYFINELEVHANLAYRCVNILMQEFYGRKRPNIHFFSYAVHGWPEHARMAQSRFEVRDSEAEFFQVKSPSRQHWLETLFDFLGGNNNVDNRHIWETYGPLQHMSILQIAAQWGISSLVDYITSQYCQESNTKNPIPLILLDCIDSDDATPIELAVKLLQQIR